MPATPKRADQKAPEGSRFPSEVVAANVRGYRVLRGLSQEQIAAAMVDLGHGWFRTTSSAVEREGRAVSVDELVSLALVLDVTVGDLLDPSGPDGSGDDGLFVGGRTGARLVVPQPLASAVARSVTALTFTRGQLNFAGEESHDVSARDEARYLRWLKTTGREQSAEVSS